jgi:hypothetical protein
MRPAKHVPASRSSATQRPHMPDVPITARRPTPRTSRIAAGAVALCLSALAAPEPAHNPTFFARRDYSLGSSYVTVFDANGDGIPDIVGTDSNVNVLLGNGDGTFREGPTSPTNFAGGRRCPLT